MNYQSTNKISAILSCSSFSMAYQPLKMATHPCVAETLNKSGFPKEFGVIGIAGYFVDLTAELSVASKTAGVFRLYRNA